MGCSIGLPRRSSSMKRTSSKLAKAMKNVIRVVHLNGHVEDFKFPILVSHLIGTPPKHVVCTRAELLSPTCKPLPPDTVLELGHLYFLLPFSAFRCDASPMDFAKIVNRLSIVAANAQTCDGAGSLSPLLTMSPSTGRRLVMEQGGTMMGKMMVVGIDGGSLHNSSSKKPSWRPILDTIGEISFTRRSESDLRGKGLEESIKKYNV